MPHSTAPPPPPTSPSNDSSPKPPRLPIELWMHILSSVSDTESLPGLWFAARATSRLLRAAAEAAFPAAHLRRWLHVCSFRIPRATLAFHRLRVADDGDKSRRAVAVLRAQPWRGFEDKPPASPAAFGGAGGEGAGVGSEWAEVLREGAERGFGDYMICLRGVVQDTEVLGWRVVSGEGDGVFEVEVEWKGMLDRLFGEELRARRRGEVLAKRFKKDREDKWAVYGPEVINDQLHFRTFEAVLLGNENHRAYQNGYRDARRQRIERWIRRVESDPERAYALRKKEIDVEWVPNFRMNAVRERLERKMVEWGEEQYPQPQVIRKRLLESDVPMKRELCTLDVELATEEDGWAHGDEVEPESYAEVGLLWKGRTPEEVEKLMRIRAYAAELNPLPPSKRRACQNGSGALEE
ncbi:uncharacterized protein BKCO1_3400039 [Diplodia corticola]|uniref:Uncharacterized protein n=1 Tax=Diplodia corticola TaxID=236234 RepID=A0A1J9RZU9_9PEZI|nr:uncharacterized protein BKCO1_3400039 [Diplodia corticola]OJD32973.1 hypothetical protein BKCO1_3400039 [Diplodia corticola]